MTHIKGLSVGLALSLFLTLPILILLSLPAPMHAANITIVPTSGTVGSSILISGKGFTGRFVKIHWDEQLISTKVPVSDTGEVTWNLTVPPACKGTHIVKITDDSNLAGSTASATFTVLPQITVFPRIGRAHTSVTVIGNGFAAFEREIKITWDGKVLPMSTSANHLGTWGISLDIPETTKGDHYIGAFSPATKAWEIGEIKFMVTPAVKVEPLSGPVGTEIRIEGFGFRTGEDGITITYDGDIIMCNIVGKADGSWDATLNIPPSTQGYHVIGVYGSSFTPKGIVPDVKFNVVPHIELELTSINRETKVTVKGTGFANEETVTISLNGRKIDVVAVADNSGSFVATFEAGQSRIKENSISAQGNKGNSARATFIMEQSAPPAPQPLSPKQGAKLEIFDSIGDVFLRTAERLVGIIIFPRQQASAAHQATFDWSDASKTGDISYVLQIAQDSFVSPVLVKNNLVESEYKLSRGDILGPGRYSWRVKAVDNVGNESPWSEIRQFEVIPMSKIVLVQSLCISVLSVAGIVIAGILVLRARRGGK